MIERSVSALSQALAAKEISSVELTQLYLERIARLNPTVNAFITVDPEKSLAQAKSADQQRAAGNAGPLTGMPLAQKDIFCTQGWLRLLPWAEPPARRFSRSTRRASRDSSL